MDSLQIVNILLISISIVFFIFLLSLFCEILHIRKKQCYVMCVLVVLMLVHKMILEFPYMYISYMILIIFWFITLINDIKYLLKKKKCLPILFVVAVFMFSLLYPAFSNLRQYYLYKPLFLLRSYAILEKQEYLSFLSYMTGKNVYVLENKVYYELGGVFSFDNTGGIVVTFDDAPSDKAWDKYISFDKIDKYAYTYIRHK